MILYKKKRKEAAIIGGKVICEIVNSMQDAALGAQGYLTN